jgi:glycosyltransferase involved in cell wall biosynthesis
MLFLGRLKQETGALTFLKVIKVLKKKVFNLRIIVAGGGAYGEDFEKEGVKCVGFVSAVKPFINQTLMVFATGYLSIIESTAGKKLVFSTYNNPLREDYLKMSPFAKWIFISDSPYVLASKIEFYLNHQESAKDKIEKAYRWVLNQTWDKMADNYEKLWGLS